MRNIVVSMGRADNLAAITKVAQTTWPKFATFLTRDPPETEDKASVGWYCPTEFDPIYRDSKNFVARHCLTFDYDSIDEFDVEEIKAVYSQYAYVMYTTSSHTPDKPRLRVVFPLDRPANLTEFCAVTRKIGSKFDLEKLARESDAPAQMMFLPSRKKGGTFWSEIHEGEWINVDKILGEYHEWTDKAEWPRRRTGDHATDPDEMVPPDTKPGIVGDFCRAFKIPEAIERFKLPYAEGSTEDRYTYTAGSRVDGARLYDDGLKLHSDHNTDPAHGQNNAFDLVRLHRFGSLDTQEDLAKPVTERPSFKAMVELALAQPEVEQARLKGEFENLDERERSADTSTDSDKKAPAALAQPLEELFSSPTKPRWLLRDKLERGVIAVLAGPRGSYKSFLGIDWALTAARDVGPVYVLSAEGMDFDRRAKAWLTTYASDWDYKRHVFVAQRRIDLNQHDNIELVRQDCLRHGIKPVMFLLDTFSKLSGALDENSNTDVKAFIGRLDNGLKRAFDATVLLIAHTGHGEKTRARGASAIEADTDAAYIMQRSELTQGVTMTRERFKSSPELDPLAFVPEIVPLGYTDDDGEMVTSLVLRATEAPKVKKVKAPTGVYSKTILAAAKDMLRSGKARSVDALVNQACIRLPAPTGRDTRKQNLSRAVQKLVADGHLYLHPNNQVSLTTAAPLEDDEDFE